MGVVPMVLSDYNRLAMDGTTKAAMHCMFLTCSDQQLLRPPGAALRADWEKLKKKTTEEELDVASEKVKSYGEEVEVVGRPDNTQEVTYFQHTASICARMKRRGFFNKPWVLTPISVDAYHWIFLGLLNVHCLGSPQEEHFSGYFIYDGFGERSSREQELMTLQQQGFLNVIVFANLVFGNPAITSTDILPLISDPERFARIRVPDADFVPQKDGCNCGIIAWMCMHEMSLCHCHNYQQMEHFVRNETAHGPVFTFQPGDWFRLYRNTTSSKHGADILSKGGVFTTIRAQGYYLYNRIVSMKSGKLVQPIHPDINFPTWVRANFRRHVWQIPDNNQLGINNWLEYLKGKKETLNQLLESRNTAVTQSEVLLDCERSVVDDLEKVQLPELRFDTLRRAGMRGIPDDGEELGHDGKENTLGAENRITENVQQKEARAQATLTDGKQVSEIERATGNDMSDDREKVYGEENGKSGGAVGKAIAAESVEHELEQSKEVVTATVVDGDEDSEGGKAVEATIVDEADNGGVENMVEKRSAAMKKKTTKENLKNTPPQPTKRPRSREGMDTTEGKVPKRVPREIQPQGSDDGTRRLTEILAYPDDSKKLPVALQSDDAMDEDGIAEKYGEVNGDDYAPNQRILEEAEKVVSSIKKIPNTVKEMMVWKKKLAGKQDRTLGNRRLSVKSKKAENDREQRAMLLHVGWQQFQPLKNVEARLRLYDSVEGIRYEVKGHVDEKDSHIRGGRFWVRLAGTGQEIPVTRNWVVSEFHEDVVKAVVKQGVDEFLDVSSSGVVVELDRRQVQKLRYVRATTPKQQSYFCGVLSNGQVKRLEDSFVDDNFPKAFVDRVMEEGTKDEPGNHKFFHIPPGAPRTMDGSNKLNLQYPKCHYMQRGDYTCLFSSFASALHYLGLHDTASKLASSAPIYSANAEGGFQNWTALLRIMEKECGWLEPRKLSGNAFDILSDFSEYPTVVSLEAEDGGTQHAITVVGKIIFDSNCERGLPLNRESLDYCCSSDEMEGVFRKVFTGYRFLEPMQKRKKILKRLAEKNCVDFFMNVRSDIY